MPYYVIDSSEFLEDIDGLFRDIDAQPVETSKQEQEEGEPHYESAEATFRPDQLKGTVLRVYRTLVDLRATSVRCRYDGGGDEGFAHFEEAEIDGERLNVRELGERLAGGPLGDIPDDLWIRPESSFEELSRAERAVESLDYFAFALAAILLGESYGTGDYSMYGSFRADIASGSLIDEME